MNSLTIIFGLVTLVFLWVNLWISLKIIKYLQEKGQEVSLFNGGFFVRGKIFKYLPLYKKVSIDNEGKVGHLYLNFYLTFFFMVTFLIFGISTVAQGNPSLFLNSESYPPMTKGFIWFRKEQLTKYLSNYSFCLGVNLLLKLSSLTSVLLWSYFFRQK